MSTGSRRGAALPMVMCLAVALPGLIAVATASPQASGVPASLDRFLAVVARDTSPAARVLTYGQPPALVFYRATYLLYPRVVYSASPTDYAHRDSAAALTFADLVRLAHRDRAGFLIVWGTSVGGATRFQAAMAGGTLWRVTR